MIKFIMYQKVKNFKDTGMPISEIVKTTGLDWKTVKKYSRMSQKDYAEYVMKLKSRFKIFEPFKQEIKEIYTENSDVKIRKSAIYDFLEEKYNNLPGTERTLRNFIDYLIETKEIEVNKKKREYLPVVDVVPGKQLQLDFGEKKQKNGQKLYIFASVLSSSKTKFYRVQSNPFKTLDVINNLINSFKFFGGIPEEIVMDQDKLMIVSENQGDIILTKKFEEFKNEQKFKIFVCRKSDPESKGSVENSVSYIKNNFFNFRNFKTAEEANEKINQWMYRRANGKINQSTKRIPLNDLKHERSFLRAYHGSVFEENIKHEEVRKVDKTSLISYLSSKYMVPIEYVGENVGVIENNDKIIITDLENGIKIAQYQKSLIPGSMNLNKKRYFERTNQPVELKEKLIEKNLCQDWEIFVEKNYKKYQRYFRDQYKAALNFLDIQLNLNILEESVKYCLENKTLSIANLKDTYDYYFREKNHKQNFIKSSVTIPLYHHQQLELNISKRDLSDYQQIIKEGGEK